MARASLSESGEIFSLYAAGLLDPAFGLLLETQSALRPDTARALANAEILSGIFLETEAPTAVSEAALDNVFSLIDAHEARKTAVQPAANIAGAMLDEILHLPEPLRDQVLTTTETRNWQSLVSGVRRLPLDVPTKADVELYRIEPGKALPRHSHKAGEFTLVVSGGYTDETGAYGPGDLSFNGAEDIHQPVADMDGVCYALSVREGGLKFTGMLGLVQKLVGH